MQIEITVAADRTTAQVGLRTLKLNEIITFKNLKGKTVGGTILAFALIDKKDMNAPWMYVQETKTGDTDWISMRNWSDDQVERNAPNEGAPDLLETIIAPPQMMSDDDML